MSKWKQTAAQSTDYPKYEQHTFEVGEFLLTFNYNGNIDEGGWYFTPKDSPYTIFSGKTKTKKGALTACILEIRKFQNLTDRMLKAFQSIDF